MNRRKNIRKARRVVDWRFSVFYYARARATGNVARRGA
jgi:hypothetical protein